MRRIVLIFGLLWGVPALAQTYGRMDFSLQNAQGQAISGATVNVYSQPACGQAATLTPAGRAQLYSSPSGGPITQPLFTDGFGHAAAYLATGCVTVVYYSPFTGTITYPDQISAAPGTGGPINSTSATGNSGPAALTSGNLNIPVYVGAAGSGAPIASDGSNGLTVTGNVASATAVNPTSPFPPGLKWIQEGASITKGWNSQKDIGITQTPGSGYSLSGTPTCTVNGGTYGMQATCVAYLSGSGIVIALVFPGYNYTVAPTSITVAGFTGGSGFTASASILPNPYSPSYSQAATSLSALNGKVSTFTSYAIEGTTVYDAIQRFTSNGIAAQCAAPNAGSWVVYDIGGDLASNSIVGNPTESQAPLTGEQTYAEYISLAHMAKAAGCKVVAESVLPRGNDWNTTTQAVFELNRLVFNQLLHSATLGTDFDYYIPMAESVQNEWDSTIFSVADFVHLNSFGNRFFAQVKNTALLNPQGAFISAAYMPSYQLATVGQSTNPNATNSPLASIQVKAGNLNALNGVSVFGSDTSIASNPAAIGFCAGATSITLYGGCATTNTYDQWDVGADILKEVGGGVFGIYNIAKGTYALKAIASASGVLTTVPGSLSAGGLTVTTNAATDAANQIYLDELSGTAYVVSNGADSATYGQFGVRAATSTGTYRTVLSIDGSGNATVLGAVGAASLTSSAVSCSPSAAFLKYDGTCGAGGTGTGFNGGLGSSYQDAAEIAAPANPAAGDDRLYLNSTTHQLACLTSAGASCLPSGSSPITWPGANAVVVSNGTNSPAGVTGTITGSVLQANNAAVPSFSVPGLALGNGGAAVTATAYTFKCDSATTTLDRGTFVDFNAASAVTATMPDVGTSGCANNFYVGMEVQQSAVTVNRTTTSTFNVYGPAAAPAGCTGSAAPWSCTSFTVSPGQQARISTNGSNWDVFVYTGAPASVANVTITTGTTAVSATCSANTLSSAVTMAGLGTGMTLTFTPTSDTSSVTGWDTGELFIVPVIGSGSFQWRLCTGNSSGTTPGGSVTWNVSAK